MLASEDATYAITPEMRHNDDLIMVDYFPQIGFWTKTAYYLVDVVRNPN
jgi:hypothetical protein